MPDIGARVHELRALETLSAGKTAIHRLHPMSKLISTVVFIIITVSFGRYDFIRLAPYIFYPFVLMALAELPYRLLLPRVLVALPFCLFAGISNIYYDRSVISFFTIMIKMYLCVMAALILVASTPFVELTAQLRRLRVPVVFIMVFEMTFRYIGVLLEEAYTMMTAYRLRSAAGKSLAIGHMGSFAGQLLLRGFDRAERVYAAMQCRGYSLRHVPAARRRYHWKDAMAMAAVCLPAIILRFAAL